MTPLAQKLSHILAGEDSDSAIKSESICPLVKLILVCFFDPVARPQNPPSPFDPIEMDLSDGVSVKLGRPVRGADVPTSPEDDKPVISPSHSSNAQTDPTPSEAYVSSPSSSSSPIKQEAFSTDASLSSPLDRHTTAVTRSAASPVKKITRNVWFKSKVVSRTHSELWMKNGQVYFVSGVVICSFPYLIDAIVRLDLHQRHWQFIGILFEWNAFESSRYFI
jgi:hypothetical protein